MLSSVLPCHRADRSTSLCCHGVRSDPPNRPISGSLLGLGHPDTAFTVYSILVFKFTRMCTLQICYLHEFEGKILFTILGLQQ